MSDTPTHSRVLILGSFYRKRIDPADALKGE